MTKQQIKYADKIVENTLALDLSVSTMTHSNCSTRKTTIKQIEKLTRRINNLSADLLLTFDIIKD